MGGGPTPAGVTTTLLYDGSSWTAGTNALSFVKDFATAKNGTQSAGIIFGGEGPTPTGASQEYNGPGQPETVTISSS